MNDDTVYEYKKDFNNMVCNNSAIQEFANKYPPSYFGLTEEQGVEYLESILSPLLEAIR